MEESSQKAAEAIGCDSFKSKVYDSMYDYLDNEQEAPQLSDFSTSLAEKIDQIALAQKIDNPEAVEKLKQNISDLYKVLIEKSAELKQTKTAKEHLQTIIEMEMEDVSTPENVQLNNVGAKAFAKVDQAVKALDVQCGAGSPTTGETEEPGDPVVVDPGTSSPGTSDPGTITDAPAAVGQKSVLVGSHNVLATAYQSCAVLEIPEVSAATADVQGIERYATHSDGIGGVRRVSSLSSVQNTHPYIKVAGGAQAGCFNVRNNPLIYDYGGQAAISNNILDFTKNAGSGSSALGIDCSAYVSASIAAGGLRYKPGVENKAVYTRQNSSKFINAANSGFTCFSNATMQPTRSIQPGDIVGVSGHVVLVDKIGEDPFGLKRLKSATDCNSMSTTYFDFIVSQSSPSKNGIGLNRYVAKDYLRESSKMTTAFLGIAKAACQAYFGSKNVATPSSTYGILRHKGTAECLSPKIQMAYQSCVSTCMK
ncbi:hypothetical protein [Pseudobdellovibrio sp. HCB154]|uniref:hypothetical protein n=1 Tax=Pseudobdellovibrio sp. HCB154 TaxID=3386277 RepID=UPI003916EF53